MAKISESTGINSIQLKEQTSAPDTPASGFAQLFVKADGLYVKDDDGNVFGPLVQREDYILIRDKKTSGTNGGSFTASGWRTRDLNEEVSDVGGHASVGSNQITLAAGTYRCKVRCPGFSVGQHQARLYDTSGSTVLALGDNAYSNYVNYGDTTVSEVTGRFTLAAQSVLEVQHYCLTTVNTMGFGLALAIGDEIYTVAEFWRES